MEHRYVHESVVVLSNDLVFSGSRPRKRLGYRTPEECYAP